MSEIREVCTAPGEVLIPESHPELEEGKHGRQDVKHDVFRLLPESPPSETPLEGLPESPPAETPLEEGLMWVASKR